MFVVKADHPNVRYRIVPPEVVDSEGNVVPAAHLMFEVRTTDPAVVAVTPDPQPEGGTALGGLVSFGRPHPDGSAALAAVTVVVSLRNADGSAGKAVGAFGTVFAVVAGDPIGIVGGGLTFEGLEAEEVPDVPANG